MIRRTLIPILKTMRPGRVGAFRGRLSDAGA